MLSRAKIENALKSILIRATFRDDEHSSHNARRKERKIAPRSSKLSSLHFRISLYVGVCVYRSLCQRHELCSSRCALGRDCVYSHESTFALFTCITLVALIPSISQPKRARQFSLRRK